MGKEPGNNDLPGKRKEEIKDAGLSNTQKEGEGIFDNTEIKNAQAAGIGALGRSDENQIEKLIDNVQEKDDDVY